MRYFVKEKAFSYFEYWKCTDKKGYLPYYYFSFQNVTLQTKNYNNLEKVFWVQKSKVMILYKWN